MSKLRFTAEDFKRCATKERHDLRQFIADEANARLKEMLRECPEVFQDRSARGHFWCWKHDAGLKGAKAEASARLVNVERIDGK